MLTDACLICIRVCSSYTSVHLKRFSGKSALRMEANKESEDDIECVFILCAISTSIFLIDKMCLYFFFVAFSGKKGLYDK